MNPQPREARRSGRVHLNISGDNSLRDPPVPIPNTEVKPQHADGTWLATARESRSSPDSILFGHVERCVLFLLPFILLNAILSIEELKGISKCTYKLAAIFRDC